MVFVKLHTKNDLRRSLLNERRSMRRSDVNFLSRKIADRVYGSVDWSMIMHVHTYIPIVRLNEVETIPLKVKVNLKHPDIRWASWQKKNLSYSPAWLNGNETLEEVNDNFQFDLIIVPLLGFNKNYYRIGYGGGIYDRFLAKQSGQKIGLCYEFGKIDFKPEPHDVALDQIFTDQY